MALNARLVVALLALALSLPIAASLSGYDNCMWLHGDPVYRLYWSVNESHVFVGLEANTTGWVGLGLSDDGTMTSSGAGSDIWVGFLDDEGVGHVNDYWTTQREMPTKDAQQDLTLAAYNYSNATQLTTLQFTRKLSTGDPNGQDKDIHVAHQGRVIWAIGAAKPTTFAAERFGKHSHKGSAQIDWEETGGVCTDLPGDADPPEIDDNDPEDIDALSWTNSKKTFSVKWQLWNNSTSPPTSNLQL